jgi:uncharacterized protein with HEPN domain
MNERSLKLLSDAVAAIEAVNTFMDGCNFADYANNHQLRSAVERQLEILGEACSQLDKLDGSWREKIPDLRLAIGLRNRIIHGYDEVDDEMVFETTQRDLPALRSMLIAFL